MFYFQSGQLGHSTNTIILKSNEHKSYAWVFGVICTFQSSQFFDRLSMHFGVVDHIRASALTTADRRPPSWNRITDSTHAPPVGNGIGEPHSNENVPHRYATISSVVFLYSMPYIFLLNKVEYFLQRYLRCAFQSIFLYQKWLNFTEKSHICSLFAVS